MRPVFSKTLFFDLNGERQDIKVRYEGEFTRT